MARCKLSPELEAQVQALTNALGSREAAMVAVKEGLQVSRQEVILSAKAYERVNTLLDNFDGDYNDAFTHLLVQDPKARAGYTDVFGQQRAVKNFYDSKAFPLLEKLEVNTLGKPKDPRFQKDFLDELSGVKTGNKEAGEMAKLWNEVAEELRLRQNHLGANIKKIEGWWFPQTHNPIALQKVGREVWMKETMPMLDLQRMAAQFPGENIEELVGRIYDNIVGVNAGKGSKTGKNNRIDSKDNQQRSLLFKDAATQQEYHKVFGQNQGDLGGSISTHIRDSSNKIALSETFGPNPEGLINRLVDEGKINLEHTTKVMNIPGSEFITPNNKDIVAVLLGKTEDIYSGNLSRAAKFSLARNWMILTKLGSATISAIVDIGSAMANNGFWGIPRHKTFINQFTSLDKKELARQGFIHDLAAGGDGVVSRFGEQNDLAAKSTVAVDGFMRVSLLNKWTDTQKRATYLSYNSHFASKANISFDKLSKRNKALLSTYDIKSAEWDILRRKGISKFSDDVDYLDISKIDDYELSTKWRKLLSTEADIATPTPGLRTRAATTGGEAGGTTKGEVRRVSTQFLSTPIHQMYQGFSRSHPSFSRADSIKYKAELFAQLSFFGYMAYNLNNVATGKEWIDPTKLNQEQLMRLMLHSIVKGGATTVVGDILLQSIAPLYGGDFAEQLTSPVVGTISDLFKHLAKGEGIDLGKLYRFGLQQVPGQNLWYTKLIFHRFLGDAIQEQLSPKAQQQFRRQMSQYYKDTNSQYWYPPGN